MSNIEILIYGVLLLWVVVVITHALTRANCVPIQVVEVRTIDHTPGIHTYQKDFVIDKRSSFVMPYDEMFKSCMEEAKRDLFFTLPNDCFEIIGTESLYRDNDLFTVKIKILLNKWITQKYTTN